MSSMSLLRIVKYKKMSKIAITLIYFLLSSSIVFAKNNDWQRCLGINDILKSYSAKPAYCYGSDLKLRSEEEIKALISDQIIQRKIEDQNRKKLPELVSKNAESMQDLVRDKKYIKVIEEDFSEEFKYKTKIFKKKFRYDYTLVGTPENKYIDAFKKSMSISNQEMVITLRPDTRQWKGDEKNKTERAEWGFYIINPITKLINRKKFIKIAFDFKLPKDSEDLFQNKRTMIFQAKHDGNNNNNMPGWSPAFAFYVQKGGAAKCVDYGGQRNDVNDQIHNNTPIRITNIYDGNWHKVVYLIKYGGGKKEGHCLVKIDDEIIFSKMFYDNDLLPAGNILTRFGVYRDEYDVIQQVSFDNIEVGYYE